MASSRAAPVRPASPEEVRAGLRSLQQVLDRVRHVVVVQVLRDADLTWSHWSVLHLVHEVPGLTSTQVARRLQLAPSTLSGLLGALRERGLVDAHPHPRDSRRILLAPTQEGDRLAVRLRREEGRCLSQALPGLMAEDVAAMTECAHRLDQVLPSIDT